MCEWATWYFTLHLPNKDGKVLYQELKQYERQSGKTPEELKPPAKFPVELSFIWTAFCSLSDTRQVGMNGPGAITYEQIKAWKDLTNQILNPRDIEAILSVDRVYRKIYYDRH